MQTLLPLPMPVYVIHKVGNDEIFVLLKFENEMHREIIHFNFNSKHYESALKLLRL